MGVPLKPPPLGVGWFRKYVPMGGVEPPRLTPPPPQDGESTKFLHIGENIVINN
ncbi:hypothetical protein CCP3SC5AM1_1150008 [Gammaproteobacteria bacterium]